RLAQDALIDGLTGLPNRKAFYDRLAAAIADGAGRSAIVGVALFDINGMKFINESFGTSIGDEVIPALSQKMRTQRGAGDTLARIGGDEFALLMTKVVLPKDAFDAAKRLASAVTGGVQTSDGEHQVSIAGGVATLTVPAIVNGQMSDRLMHQASHAMM